MPRHPGEYADARRADGALRRPGVAGEHRLDRRAVRDGRAHEHQPHAVDGAGRPRRTLDDVPTVTDPIFGVEVPTSCPDVPSEVLQPRATWPDPEAYDKQAR